MPLLGISFGDLLAECKAEQAIIGGFCVIESCDRVFKKHGMSSTSHPDTYSEIMIRLSEDERKGEKEGLDQMGIDPHNPPTRQRPARRPNKFKPRNQKRLPIWYLREDNGMA